MPIQRRRVAHVCLVAATMLSACNMDDVTAPRSYAIVPVRAIQPTTSTAGSAIQTLLSAVCGGTLAVRNTTIEASDFAWDLGNSTESGIVSVLGRQTSYIGVSGAGLVRLFARQARTHQLTERTTSGTTCVPGAKHQINKSLLSGGYHCGSTFLVRNRNPVGVEVRWVVGEGPGRSLFVPAGSAAAPAVLYFDGEAAAGRLMLGSARIARLEGSGTACRERIYPARFPAVTAGDGQSLVVGATAPIVPAVLVRNALDQPIGGVRVDFSLGTGYGILTGATAVTDAQGIAVVGSWEVDAFGVNTLSAITSDSLIVDHSLTWSANARNLQFVLDGALPGDGIFGIWGTSATDLFASGGHRTVLHYDGASWQLMNHPAGSARFRIHGVATNAVFAVGQWGAIRYDGSQWHDLGAPSSEWFGVWAASATDVWIAGDGRVEHWDGASWTALPTGLSTAFNDDRLENISGTGPDDVFIVGRKGIILHWDGSQLVRMTSGTTTPLSDVFALAPDDVWAVGNGAILHYDGTSWSTVSTMPGAVLRGVWGSGQNNVYFGGESGLLLRWDGQAIVSVPSGTTRHLFKLFGLGPERLYAGAHQLAVNTSALLTGQ